MRKRECRKLISLLLILCMLLTAIPASADSVELSGSEMTKVEQQASTVVEQQASTVVEQPQLSATAQILSEDCKILNYVHAEVFSSANHVARLTSEETLSSYVFLNEDGTRTAYFMDEAVKFVDANGIIQEKDLTLVPTVGGYTTEKNDIELTLPTDPSKGITLLWNNTAVRIIPQGGTVGQAVVEDNTVRYVDYYGNGADLVYTPTLSGLKEDIILESYAGKNTFTFMLNTGGLRLYSANGRYFLAASKTATERIELGDVVSFDARGRFSVGTMTAQTVTAGQIYRLTLTVDEAFLTDPNTVYPVSIDPTLTVSDNTHGSGAIEDVSIYQGRPTTNGNWTYLHSGYYDSNYTVSRTLFRLNGLINSSEYQSLTASKVNSAYFYIWEASGTTAANVSLRANTGSSTWTESGATWNNAGVVLGTTYDTQSIGINAQARFTITNLIKDWLNTPANAQKGFVLQSSNETSLDKAFYSSEHGTTTRRPYVMVNYSSPISLNCTSLTMYKNATYTFTATNSSSGGNITWSSSDQAVAKFVANGVLAAVREGTTVVTATNEDGYSANCIVYVRMVNGVYRLQNQNSDLYLSVNTDNLKLSNNATQQTLETITANPLQYYAQLWKIEYLANGLYSIRPMYSLSYGLTASGTLAIASEIGTTTSLSGVPSASQWTIRYDNGYVIQQAGLSGKTLLTPNSSTTDGANLGLGDYLSSTTANRWNISAAESISDTLLLIDIENGTIANSYTRHISPGETRNLADMNIVASFVSASTNAQDITTSTSSANVYCSSLDKSVTGLTPNSSANVLLQMHNNGVLYTRILDMRVSYIPEGTYLVCNREWGTFLQLDNDASDDYAVSGTTVEVWPYSPQDPQKWIFTRLDDGYFKIISEESGLALSVPSGRWNSADYSLVQYQYTGASNQRWQITASTSGTYIIRPKSASNYTTDWSMCVGNIINEFGNTVVQRRYTEDSNMEDEWYFISPSDVNLDLGMSTDNANHCSCDDRPSYRLANNFIDILRSGIGDDHISATHRYNMGYIKTASKRDFSVNGAISNDIDFMAYIGHGHIALNDNTSNHLHYSCSSNGVALGDNGDCEDENFNAYLDEINFGSSTSDLRWVWLYTCNFLTEGTYVSEDDLRNKMTGAHIVMGYGSQSYLCDPAAELFAAYLIAGKPIIDSFFAAGYVGESVHATDNHIQKVLYIPQVEQETIYSPYLYYDYGPSDVVIITHYIDDAYFVD